MPSSKGSSPRREVLSRLHWQAGSLPLALPGKKACKVGGVLEEEAEAQRCEVTCLRSHGKSAESWGSNPTA